MRYKKKTLFVGLLVLAAILLRLYSADAQRVETGYATGIYPSIAKTLRFLLGWIPFSLGDFVYGIFAAWCIWKLIRGVQLVYRKKASWKGFALRLGKIVVFFLLVYIVFNSFWGINYNRKGIAYQLSLKMDKYNLDELKNINWLLLQKVNGAKQQLVNDTLVPLTTTAMFTKVQEAYASIDSNYPFLDYRRSSLKPSIWGWLGNYVGFAGYYNPFTGEAQVNTTMPKFLQPFTACHEVAHQLGYAKEMEANFVGYLAASNSGDQRFQYSVYLDLFLYSNRNLFGIDSASAKTYAQQLLPEIKTDLKEWREFNRRHKNPVEPVIRWLYGKYLQSNQQPQGVLSYDEVTSFLIAYYKKFGRI
jgi:cytochrome b561